MSSKLNKSDTIEAKENAKSLAEYAGMRTDEFDPDPEDAPSRKSILKNVAGFIIVTEFCERYGIEYKLIIFLILIQIF